MTEKQADHAANTFEQRREQSLDQLMEAFSLTGDGSAKLSAQLRTAMRAAFMHGAWAGRTCTSSEIMDLGQRDRDALLASIDAGREARAQRLAQIAQDRTARLARQNG